VGKGFSRRLFPEKSSSGREADQKKVGSAPQKTGGKKIKKKTPGRPKKVVYMPVHGRYPHEEVGREPRGKPGEEASKGSWRSRQPKKKIKKNMCSPREDPRLLREAPRRGREPGSRQSRKQSLAGRGDI